MTAADVRRARVSATPLAAALGLPLPTTEQVAVIEAPLEPLLVVAGAEDATFPLTETKAMADSIPGAEFVVLDGVAHLAALENPALTNTLIRDFLGRA